VSIADQGCGVRLEDREHIFDRFWRGKDRTSEGAGLGLAIVAEIMRAHEGSVKVESNYGSGTSFTLTFPLSAIIGIAGTLMLAKAQQNERPVLIAGDRPVTVDQVLAKLKSDGWSDIVILPDGRYLQVTGTRNGQTSTTAVDSQTGRLGVEDDDGDDD
jgi:Histidine kinase-, DNA gyrase B-, and HSP90-like ATPase